MSNAPVVVRTVAEMRHIVSAARARTGGAGAAPNQSRHSLPAIALVPTMGALHEGHASLIRRARAECAFVVVSVFVNPIQFDRKDDYERYPRGWQQDEALCASLGVDALFAPCESEMYPARPLTTVEVAALSEHLCGAFRPGHFRGVATVVAKLFNIVQPDRAYFGEKDAQQLAIIRRMVSDLNIPVRVEPVATVREADGLAISSRNKHLSSDERRAAPTLHLALREAAAAVERGCDSPAAARDAATAVLRGSPLIRAEYLEVVDPETMQPAERIQGPVRIAAAAWLGNTRLIDNVLAYPPRRP